MRIVASVCAVRWMRIENGEYVVRMPDWTARLGGDRCRALGRRMLVVLNKDRALWATARKNAEWHRSVQQFHDWRP